MEAPASTRKQMLACLRRGALTVSELAQELDVSRNAVLFQLTELETQGLVRKSDFARTGRAGKPAQRYEINPEGLERASPAYMPVSCLLLAAGAKLGEPMMSGMMTSVGVDMHQAVAEELRAEGPIGLQAATEFLTVQGAEIEISDDAGDVLVFSHSCPIGQLVRTDRRICDAIARFLGEACDAEGASECLYEDKLTCRFRLSDAMALDRAGEK